MVEVSKCRWIASDAFIHSTNFELAMVNMNPSGKSIVFRLITTACIGGPLVVHAAEPSPSTSRPPAVVPATSADPLPSTTLPAVTVTAAPTPTEVTEGSGSYTSPTVTIGKMPASMRETPQSISVITRQRLDDQELTNLEEALAKTTGVTQVSNGTGGGDLYVRGFLINNYQYDGVAIPQSGLSFSSPDLFMFDRIEIIRGSAGLLQGTGNPSAVVNLVRKRPTPYFQANGGIYYGSWDYYRGEADVSGPLNGSGSIRGRISTGIEDRHYFTDVSKSNKKFLYGAIDFDLSSSTLLTVGGAVQRTSAVPQAFGIPRYPDGTDIGLPRSTFLAPAWSHYDVDVDQTFASLRQDLGGDWAAKVSVEHQEQSMVGKRAYAYGVNQATGASSLLGLAFDQDYRYTGLDVNASGPVNAFGRKHTLVFGGDYQKTNSDFRNARLATIPINIFNFDPYAIPEPSDPNFTAATLTSTQQYGLYGSARLSIADPLTLVLGARLNWWDTNVRSRNLGTGVETTTSDASVPRKVIPYAGLIYDLNKTSSIYASYTNIFTPQVTQLSSSGSLLKPIEGKSYEVGLKNELMDKRLNTSIALFRVDQVNRAQQDADNPCATATNPNWCYVAQGKVRSQGVELEASGEVVPGWQLYAGYTFNTTKFLDDQTNSGNAFMTQTPKHIFRVWTMYRLPNELNKWSVGGGVNVQSGYYVLENGVRASQGGFATADLALGYEFNSSVSALLKVNNIFDRRYYTSLQGVNYGNMYGDPRNVMLTVRAKY